MQREKVIQTLLDGGIGILPTDTLYGVVANAHRKGAVERIYTLKGRDENKPFIILISDVADLSHFGIKITKQNKAFLDLVWPGPVSVILPCTLKKYVYLHRGTQSLAFRLPKNASLRALLAETGPLVAPSANPQGKTPAYTLAEAKKYFAKDVDFYVSGGRKEGKPSRIVSLVSGEPVVLRP